MNHTKHSALGILDMHMEMLYQDNNQDDNLYSQFHHMRDTHPYIICIGYQMSPHKTQLNNSYM